MIFIKTVTIACPIRDRAWILPLFLEHIKDIDYPKESISLLFVLNECMDESKDILAQFKEEYQNEYKSIIIDQFKKTNIPNDERSSKVRQNHIYSHLANLRNYILSKTKTDYLFSCDSDVLVPSNIISKLMSHKVDVVSALIWNGYVFDAENPYKYPNILNFDEYGVLRHVNNYWVKNSPNLTESKLIPVDCSGAAILMTKEVTRKTRYGWDAQGEDAHWSRTVKENGYQIYSDLSCYCQHIMSPEYLPK